MEVWSIRNGSTLHKAELVDNSEEKGDLESLGKRCGTNDGDWRVRNMFDHVLSVFLRDFCGKQCARPVPALLGEGQQVDLFKLFCVVRKLGGYYLVSKNGSWVSVAEECWLDGRVMASIKLVYVKYLREFDRWLERAFSKKNLGSEKLNYLLLDLETELRSLTCKREDLTKNNCDIVKLKHRKNGKYTDSNIEKKGPVLLSSGDISKMHVGVEEAAVGGHDLEPRVNVSLEIAASNKLISKKGADSRKRKREGLPLLEMLNWVLDIAKHPDDPAIGKIPPCSKWKDLGSKELWFQALSAREALVIRRHIRPNIEESLLQKKQKIHPSMYDDNVGLGHQSAEKFRCSERLPSLTKPRFCPCCNSCTTTQTKVVSPRKEESDNTSKLVTAQKAEVGNLPKAVIAQKTGVENIPEVQQPPANAETLSSNGIDCILGDDPSHKQVSVGPLFQAKVPEWTGIVADIDSKWLGSRMWPPQNGDDSLTQMASMGKGRQDSCTCQLPGSVACIRFHVAENRLKLKLEIGSLFYHWRFDRMGEEVSLAWTSKQEKRFKTLVRLRGPFLNKTLWDAVPKFFPNKTRENLVNYYFNVFILQCRRYQNRVTPRDIDSDDDETEFGSIGDGYGLGTLNAAGSELPICIENKQCTGLE